MNKKIAASELVINPDGSVYHLKLKPGELATKIICVGDPDRVEKVSRHFDTIELTRQKREFVTATGYVGDQRLSVISTGIGTDNMDIVMTEIDALFNIDFDTREVCQTHTPLQFLRLGTCGGLQPDIPVGTIVNSRYAIGGDGLMHYYEYPIREAFKSALDDFVASISHVPLPLYATEGDAGFEALVNSTYPEVVSGITFTAGGFFGPQGRSVGRLRPTLADLPEQLAGFSFERVPVANMEMETSALLGMAGALGHHAASLCVILANRQMGTFSEDPAALVSKLIKMGIAVMCNW